jgi:GAF domain-containing protein
MTIAQELAEMTRLVDADDFGSTLDRFTARLARTVPGCDKALITVRSGGRLETAAGKLDVDPALTGPIVEAATYGEPRRLPNTELDQRWPEFSARLSAAGYCSCLALPLATSGEGGTAVLTLLAARPDQFADTVHDIVMLLTLNAGVLFDNAKLYHDSQAIIEQLRAALITRSLVGQAQGMLMNQFHIDAEHAFDVLRRSSQNSNTKVRELADLLVKAHHNGEFEAALTRLAMTAAS